MKNSKNLKFSVESTKLAAFCGRSTDAAARPCIFEDKRRKQKLDRKSWKNELKKGNYDL